MTDNATTEVAAIGVRVLDDAYLAWFSAESECEHALHAWFQSTGEQRATAYSAYRASLEREAAAARDLARPRQSAEPCRGAVVPGTESVVE